MIAVPGTVRSDPFAEPVMGTILEFRLPRDRRPAKPVSLDEPPERAQILFFVGVRYSRPDDDENRSLRNSAKRRQKRQNM